VKNDKKRFNQAGSKGDTPVLGSTLNNVGSGLPVLRSGTVSWVLSG